MFTVLEFFPSHRKFLKQSRLDKYLPLFQQFFHDKKNRRLDSESTLFPVAFFGYYGIIWPIVAVAAIFFVVDFLVLINVNNDIFNNDNLISVYEFVNKPIFYIGVWISLGYSFDFLLYASFKDKLNPLIKSNEFDAKKIYNDLRPKTWRGFLVTFVFFLATSAPSV